MQPEEAADATQLDACVPVEGDVRFVARRALRTQLDALHEHGTRVRVDGDPDAVHDMRVATRRLRATLGVFKDSLPTEATLLRQALKPVAASLGTVRDQDVQLERLEDWRRQAPPSERAAYTQLVTDLRRRRAAAYATLASLLNAPPYHALLIQAEEVVGSLLSADDPTARTPAALHLPALIRRRWKQLRKQARKLGRNADPAAFHEARIRGKKLRYAVECAESVYGKPARAYAARLAQMQDLLGTMHDQHVAAERYRALALETNVAHEASVQFVLGELCARSLADARHLQERAPGAVRVAFGARWKRLTRAMQLAAREALPEPPPDQQP